jgi:hypothetical protein
VGGSITYDQIRRANPSKFHDLESSMRLLYDHDQDGKGAGSFSDEEALYDKPKSGRRSRKGAGGRGRKRAIGRPKSIKFAPSSDKN